MMQLNPFCFFGCNQKQQNQTARQQVAYARNQKGRNGFYANADAQKSCAPKKAHTENRKIQFGFQLIRFSCE